MSRTFSMIVNNLVLIILILGSMNVLIYNQKSCELNALFYKCNFTVIGRDEGECEV